MATEDPMRIMAASGMRRGLGLTDNIRSSGGGAISSSSAHEGVVQELGRLLRSHSRAESMLNKRDVVPHRSGSAPPSVEGSLASMGGLYTSGLESGGRFSGSGSGDGIDIIDSEQELRSDPAYLAYYHSHINLNPRLPPPLLSRENYLLAQRPGVGGFGDKRNLRSFDDSSSRSLFSSQPVLPTHNEEPESEEEKSPMGNPLRHVPDKWVERRVDGLLGSSSYGLVARPKSLVDLIQEDFPRTHSPVYNQLQSSCRSENEDVIDETSGLDVHLAHQQDSSMSAAVAELNAALLGSRSATPSAVLASRSATPNPSLNSHSATPNLIGVHVIGSNNSIGAASGGVPRISTPGPSSMSEVYDISGLNSSSNTGISQLRSGSLTGSSTAAGAAELAAALKGFSLSNMEGNASVEQHEQLQLPTQPQQQLHQEQRDQHQSMQHQQSQWHHPRSHSSQAQSQMSQSQVFPQALHHQQHFSGIEQNYRGQGKYSLLNLSSQSQNINLQPGAPNNMYAAAAAAAAMSYMAAGNPYYQNMPAANIYSPQYGLGGYAMNPALIPGIMTNYPSPAAYDTAAVAAGMGGRSPGSMSPGRVGLDMQQLYKYTGQPGTSLQSHLPDPLYLHYLQQRSAEDARTTANMNDPSFLRGYVAGNHIDPLELQKSQLSSMVGYPTEHKAQLPRSGSLGVPLGSKGGSISPVYYGSPPGVGFVMPYANSPISSPVLPGSPITPAAFSLRQAERSYRLSPGAARTTIGSFVGWQGQTGIDASEELKGSSLLEELKNNKIRKFELADITGHVVEFSADQHGSRFIQQKLETASPEEKTLVFQEVLPQALTLMTDVFGNYVIQKFFEHGTSQQRSELANHLTGYVLNLSLQMYGCRVIQKALEVVDVEQQIRLVSELDGHVMRCVRDQNGNHVIQKCIECVPPDHVNCIISAFYGQVFILSTHPYGCRVIQRVLEHCTDDQKQRGIMEEILRSACTLAQDQYGNYVVQHVLEHGKQDEKSEILTKLAGQIVQMSQHKFASNVIEKCLEFGGPAEREILINEMLGDTDDNEPLQAMMKDQYANYVVQKVLETCDDQQRELLLSRIRVHLHALKKYTYGKHIVARVEKLVAAGERCGAQMTST